MMIAGPDEQMPYDQNASEAQANAIRARLPKGARVLDLGCGTGRVASLLRGDLQFEGVDRNPTVLAAFAEQTGGRTHHLDLVASTGALPKGPFDVVLLLGNTLMEIAEPLDALRLFGAIASRLNRGGVFAIDDFPLTLWRDVADGLWCNGIDEAGQIQMVWAPGEAVFALRFGDGVNPDATSIRMDERVFRLYSLGELRLFCALSGLEPPIHDETGGVLFMTRHDGPATLRLQ